MNVLIGLLLLPAIAWCLGTARSPSACHADAAGKWFGLAMHVVMLIMVVRIGFFTSRAQMASFLFVAVGGFFLIRGVRLEDNSHRRAYLDLAMCAGAMAVMLMGLRSTMPLAVSVVTGLAIYFLARGTLGLTKSAWGRRCDSLASFGMVAMLLMGGHA